MKQPAHDLHLCMVSPSAAHCSFNATLQDALPSCVVLPCPSIEAAQAAVHDLILLHSAARCVDTAGRSAKLGQDERRLGCCALSHWTCLSPVLEHCQGTDLLTAVSCRTL